ncbi:MAG: BREX system P-loop protein BrxC, partial [Anaerolineae bacterium]|nr:BREX system P-loop protein BrxC [Anaerolineae bacterium]
YTFFLTDLRQQEDRLLDAKEEVLDPLRHFMSGPNKTIYDEARRFVTQQEPNFTAVSGDQPAQLQALLDDPHCYRGNQMQRAKGLVEALRVDIERRVQQERAKAIEQANQLQSQMQSLAEYEKLP